MGNFEGSNQMHAKKLEPLTPTQVPYKKNKLSVYMHDSRADSRVLNGFLTRNQC